MKKQLLVVLLVLFGVAAWAQPTGSAERAKMENERKAIQKELRDLQAQYSQIKGKTKATLGQLKVIQDRMEVQNRLLRSIDKEIHILSDDIYLSTLEINRLQRQLDTLKRQYAQSVVYAYKNRSSYDYLNFIFSAGSFNDALKRVRYLRTYRLYRQSQLTTIQETAKAIEERKQQLLAKRNDKNRALENQTEQYNELEDQKKEKDRVATQLKSQEKELSQQLASKRKRDNQLKSQIAAMIRREIEAAKKEAERREAERHAAEAAAAKANPTAPKTSPKAPPKPKTESVLIFNEGERALAATFERNKGNLPWPVDQGSVKIPYGISKVGGLDFDNAFLTLSTPSAGASVKAVFDGEVTMVTGTADVMTVMIRHGKYFTIYSGLANVSVTKGTQVKRGQSIGTTSEDDDGSGGKLDFGMQMEFSRLNPSSWLHR